MGRRPKTEPKKTAKEYWLEDLNSRLARTSFAVTRYAQIEAGIKLTDKELKGLIDGVIRALVASQKSAQMWIKEHK
jgi:hypothetical protein